MLGQTRTTTPPPSKDIDDIIANIVEYISDDNDEDETLDLDVLYDDLNYLYDNKINLPTATKEELERLHFLNNIKIENLLAYIYTTKGINSLEELMLVDDFDFFTIDLLTPFVTISKPKPQSHNWKPKELFRYTRHQLYSRTDATLEQKRGYATNAYLGSPMYQQLRYSFKAGKQLNAGLSAEKDAGEQFWGSNHKGFDSYSGYIEANSLGKIDKIIVGDFRVTFGQGLIISNAFFNKKSSDVLRVMPTQKGISHKASADEYNFFRGVGVSSHFGNLYLTALYSNRYFDADTTGGSFSSIQKTGLHREMKYWENRRTVNMQVVSANASYVYKDLRVSASFYQNWQ